MSDAPGPGGGDPGRPGPGSRRRLAVSLALGLGMVLPNVKNAQRCVDELRRFTGRTLLEKEGLLLRTRNRWGEPPNPRHPERFRPERYEALLDLAALALEHTPPRAGVTVVLPASLEGDTSLQTFVGAKLQYFLYPRSVTWAVSPPATPTPACERLLVFPGARSLPARATLARPLAQGGGLYTWGG